MHLKNTELAPIMDLFQVALAPRMDLIWLSRTVGVEPVCIVPCANTHGFISRVSLTFVPEPVLANEARIHAAIGQNRSIFIGKLGLFGIFF